MTLLGHSGVDMLTAQMQQLQSNIEKKQDSESARVAIHAVEERIDRVERLAEKSSHHSCYRGDTLSKIQEDISSIQKTLNSWKTIKTGAVITLVVAILSGAYFIFEIRGDQRVLSAKFSDVKKQLDSTSDDEILDSIMTMRKEIHDMAVLKHKP
jgi:prefoldin subunit 5